MTQGGITKIAVSPERLRMARPDWRGRTRSPNVITRVSAKATVERNSTDVAAALATMLAAKPEVVIAISAYASCAEFIKQAKAEAVGGSSLSMSLCRYPRAGAGVGASSRRRRVSPVMLPPTANSSDHRGNIKGDGRRLVWFHTNLGLYRGQGPGGARPATGQGYFARGPGQGAGGCVDLGGFTATFETDTA